MAKIHDILKKYWGYDQFRPLQEDIVQSVLDGRDTLGLMPTGGGKSITFQVPALAMEGTCIVVTPLIALMLDQVDNLKKRGIKAVAIHSGLSRNEMLVALDNVILGDFKFLYLSPERLASDIFIDKLKQMKICMLAIDEAHCISQWGYDFRPSYLQVAHIRELLPDTPILALTATATPTVVLDIQEKLQFRKLNLLQKSFERKNLVYVVRETEEKEGTLIKIIRSVGGSGLVYVRSRKKTKEIAELLNLNGISAMHYHAGLTADSKAERQQKWVKNQIQVIVATNAFGMGIDKADVRFVVHWDVPDSPEAYFQEAGRAGRDEKKAYAVLLWSKPEKSKLERRVDETFPEPESIIRVYEALGHFLQVPVGYGFQQSYDFNIGQFCSAFHFSVIHVHSSLQILQRAGYIEFSEDVDLPSRIMITCSRDELYKFQVSNAYFDAFIKLILRSYTGLFTDYVMIDEHYIAQHAKLSRQEVYEALSKLGRLGILHYIPQRHTPLIVFTTAREETKRVVLGKEAYLDRKIRYAERINAMLDYADGNSVCRSRFLLNYFGEKDAPNCGVCDVCVEMKKSDLSPSEFQDIEKRIQETVKQQTISIEDLPRKINVAPDKAIRVIRWLEDHGVMYENEEGFAQWCNS